ncbi:MAG TPA: polysaccharide deacetylase family protein [Rudaea sp.]
MRRFVLMFAATLTAAAAHAAGPQSVARSNRALWPDATDSASGFDRASRAELLAFGQQLAATDALDDDAWRARLHLKEIDAAHLAHMREVYWQRLAHNFALASAACAPQEPFCAAAKDVAAFKEASRHFDVPATDRYRAWYENAQAFHRIYLDELLRLAALFPHVSSEVDTFGAGEFTGSELADREFFLTFDDGPSAPGGSTEKLLAVLRGVHLDATFFVLGNNLQARPAGAALKPMYAGMCVAMHGWEHRSHSSWAQWQDSVTKTSALVRERLPAEYVALFRPPYGQRKADSAAFFVGQGLKVALWNIDSQDWNNSVTGSEAGQRVLTLMLLWRHGIVLFHDIHDKAPAAVPYLVAQTQHGAVKWMACRQLGAGESR